MTDTTTAAAPAAFAAEDFAKRMERAARQAADAGLTGVLVAPGPDLIYFTGYMPVAITERITMLVIQADVEPALIVPILERPDAEAAPGASVVTISDWTDGSDHTTRPRRCSSRAGATRSPTRRGRCTCSVCKPRCRRPRTCR
jgi:D-alanyl-D-alanine dipeptidase